MMNSRKSSKSKARNSDVGPSGPSREQYLSLDGNSNTGRVLKKKSSGPKKSASVANSENVDPKPKCAPPPPKVTPPVINSLGSAVGMVKTSYEMSTANQEIDVLQPQRFATLFKTMATIYMKPVCQWQSETVDAIMQEGEALYIDSRNASFDEPKKKTEIYNEYEVNILREFSYEEVDFHVELKKKIALKTAADDDNDDKNPDVKKSKLSDLYTILKKFFRSDDLYGVILLDDWYLMIWRHQSIYFVADYYGRRVYDFKSDRENGYAMIISLRAIENVMHLILNLSNLTEDTTYSFRPMVMAKLKTPDGRVQIREFEKRKNEFCTVHDNYAYLISNIHLYPHGRNGIYNEASLPAAILAIISAKIDKAGTWTSKQLEYLICYGSFIRKMCWMPTLPTDDPKLIESFPKQLLVGQFVVEIAIQSSIMSGDFLCVPATHHTQLATYLTQIFEHGDFKLILQINFQIYSIWFNRGYIYFFDPYPHHLYGSAKKNHTVDRYASLRIFRSMKYFLCILNMVLCEQRENAKFYLHAVKIKSIASIDNKIVAQRCEEKDDCISLNETLCIDLNEGSCENQDDVSYLSDSSVPSSDLSSSSTCISYEVLEEEEHEGGLGGDYSGVESSSSHETVKKKQKQSSGGGKLREQPSKITVTVSNKSPNAKGDNKKKIQKKHIRYPVSPQGVVGEPIEKSSDSQIGKRKKNKKKKNKSKRKQSLTSLLDEPEIVQQVEKYSDDSSLDQAKKGAKLVSTDDSQDSDRSGKKGKKSKKEVPKDAVQKVETETQTEFEPVKEVEPAKVDKIPETAKKEKEQPPPPQDDKNKRERSSSFSQGDKPKKGATKKGKNAKKKRVDNTPDWYSKKLNDSSTDLDGVKKSDLINSLEPSVSNLFDSTEDEKGTKNVFDKKKDDTTKVIPSKPDKSKSKNNNKRKQKSESEKTDKDQNKNKEKQSEKIDQDQVKNKEKQSEKIDQNKERREKTDQDQDKNKEQREKIDQNKERREKTDQDQNKNKEQREKTDQDQNKNKEKLEKIDQYQDKNKEKLEKIEQYQDINKEKLEKIDQDQDKKNKEKQSEKTDENQDKNKEKQSEKTEKVKNKEKDKFENLTPELEPRKRNKSKNKNKKKVEDLIPEEATNIDIEKRKLIIPTAKKLIAEKVNQLKTLLEEINQAEEKRKKSKTLLEEKNAETAQQDGGKKSEVVELIDKTQIEIEENRIEKHKRREYQHDAENVAETPALKTTQQENADGQNSEENLRNSFGEIFLKKLNNKNRLPTIWEESETQEQQDATTDEVPENAEKPKKKKNKKKLRKSKKEQEIFCNIESDNSETKLQYEEQRKDLDTAEEICKYYLDKLQVQLKEQGCDLSEFPVFSDHVCCKHHCIDPNEPYPGVSEEPTDFVIIKTHKKSHGRLMQLLRQAFQGSDRILVHTSWDDFVVFRYCDSKERAYYLYTGCFCNLNRFRFMDLRTGKRGLIRLPNLNAVIIFIRNFRYSRQSKCKSEQTHEEKIDEILAEYANK